MNDIKISKHGNFEFFYISLSLYFVFLQQPEDVRRTLTDKKGDTSAVSIKAIVFRQLGPFVSV